MVIEVMSTAQIFSTLPPIESQLACQHRQTPLASRAYHIRSTLKYAGWRPAQASTRRLDEHLLSSIMCRTQRLDLCLSEYASNTVVQTRLPYCVFGTLTEKIIEVPPAAVKYR